MSGRLETPLRASGGGTGACRPDELRARARGRLYRDPPERLDDPDARAAIGDHDLNAGQPFDLFFKGPLRPAAVLVPIMARPEGATVLLTRRCDDLPAHAGQISFPGGKVDPGDSGPLDAALREAEEEVGLGRRFVDPIGFLDLYLTGTGYAVVPTVALVDPAAPLKPDPSEVVAIFEVPLAFLMEPANHQRHSRMLQGYKRNYYAMPYGDHYIWGATAGILRNLYNRIYR